MTVARGTTPTHVFLSDINLDGAEACYITYAQRDPSVRGGLVVLEKILSDLTIKAHVIAVRLTQEDTLGFKAGVPVEIQIRVRFPGGAALNSNVIITEVDRILKEGVI